MKHFERFRLEDILKGFSEEQLKLIFRNMDSIELTEGCSIGCDFCGVEAKKGVRARMPFEDIERLADLFGQELALSQPITYWATDPLDWSDETRDYEDILRLFVNKLGYKPYVSTAIPKGKENLALKLLLQNKISRVSVSHMNFHRLRDFFLETYPQLRSNGFEIKATEAGKEVVFTDKPNSHGDQAWIELVLGLITSRYQNSFYIFTRDGKRGREKIQRLGLKNLDNLDKDGISCSHGTLLRSSGLYNVRATPVTREFPQGIVYEKITPQDFKVWHLWKRLHTFYDGVPHEYGEHMSKVTLNQEAVMPFDARTIPSDPDNVVYQCLLSAQALRLGIFEAANFNVRNLVNNHDLCMADDMAKTIISFREEQYKDALSKESSNPYLLRYKEMARRIEEGRERIWRLPSSKTHEIDVSSKE
jgi:hypothetical protein